MVKYVLLTKEFYNDYITFTEIEQKENRPYSMAVATINNIDFAIPLRSNIIHAQVVWSDRTNRCGQDLSKSIVITNKVRYIDDTNKAHIRQNEFNALRGKEHIISERLKQYIKIYTNALEKQHLPDKRLLCQYTTLQYFHQELGINAIQQAIVETVVIVEAVPAVPAVDAIKTAPEQ